MPLQKNAWRVLMRAKETTYGTPVALGGGTDFLTTFKGEPLIKRVGERHTDADEYTGSLYLIDHEVERWKFDFSHARNLTPNEFAWAMGLFMGSCASTLVGVSTYRHIIEFNESTLTLPSTTYYEHTPLKQVCFPGLVIGEVNLGAPKGKYTLLELKGGGSGQQAAGSDLSAKTRISGESYLKSPALNLKVGGTYSEAAGVGSIAGGASIAGKLGDFKLAMNNGAEPNYGYNSTSGYVTEWRRADMKSLGLFKLTTLLEPTDDAELDWFLNQTENALELIWTGAQIEAGPPAYSYQIKMLFPRAKIDDAEIGSQKSIQTLPTIWLPLKTAADSNPICQVQVFNTQASYFA